MENVKIILVYSFLCFIVRKESFLKPQICFYNYKSLIYLYSYRFWILRASWLGTRILNATVWGEYPGIIPNKQKVLCMRLADMHGRMATCKSYFSCHNTQGQIEDDFKSRNDQTMFVYTLNPVAQCSASHVFRIGFFLLEDQRSLLQERLCYSKIPTSLANLL